MVGEVEGGEGEAVEGEEGGQGGGGGVAPHLEEGVIRMTSKKRRRSRRVL